MKNTSVLVSMMVVAGLAGCDQSSGPNMRIEAQTMNGYSVALLVTSDDDSPFTVQRVVFNEREGEAGCDWAGHTKPVSETPNAVYDGRSFVTTTLKRGDSTSIPFACGSQLIKAEVYTDRGTKSVELGDSKQGN
jgi:hypothetical protein